MTEPIATAIAAYRAELADAAPLADAELDELVEHLCAAIDAGIAAGRPEPVAISAALDRVGPPAALARECFQVRSGFAARLPPWRAWSAAAVVVATTVAVWLRGGDIPGIGLVIGGVDDGGAGNLGLVPIAIGVIGAVLVVGLVGGGALARVVLLGYLAASSVWTADHWLHTHPRLYAYAVETRHLNVTLLVAMLGYLTAVVLIAPWRRRELSRSGWAVALAAAAVSTPLHSTMTEGWLVQLAVIYGVLAVLGIGLRARWGSAISVLTAVTLAVIVVQAAGLYLEPWGRTTSWVGFVRSPGIDAALSIGELAIVVASVGAAVAAGVLGWRRARRGVGDPRGLTA